VSFVLQLVEKFALDEQAQLLGFLDDRSRRVEGALQEQRIKSHAAQTLLRELEHTVTGVPAMQSFHDQIGHGSDPRNDYPSDQPSYAASDLKLPLVYPYASPSIRPGHQADFAVPAQALTLLEKLRSELNDYRGPDSDTVSLAASDRRGPYGIMGPPRHELATHASVRLVPPKPTRAHLLRFQSSRDRITKANQLDRVPTQQKPGLKVHAVVRRPQNNVANFVVSALLGGGVSHDQHAFVQQEPQLSTRHALVADQFFSPRRVDIAPSPRQNPVHWTTDNDIYSNAQSDYRDLVEPVGVPFKPPTAQPQMASLFLLP